MAVVIGSGISIGPGITISTEVSGNMRAQLSAAGQTAYDAALINNFFAVSASDYGNVATNLTSVTKYVMNDVQVATTGGGWTANYATAHPSSVATVPSGTYIIGFVCRPYSVAATVTPLISTTFPPSGASYAAIANSISAATGGALNYFVRKAPTTTTASTSYLGLVMNQTGGLNTTLGAIQGYYSVSGPPYTSFTSWNGGFLNFQVLGTPDLQW